MKRCKAPLRALDPLRRILASFSMRLAVVISMLFAGATLLAGGASYWLQSSELRTKLTDEAHQMTASLANAYAKGGIPELSEQIATRVATDRDLGTIYLFMPDPGVSGGEGPRGNFALAHPFTGARVLVAGKDIAVNGPDGAIDGETYLGYGLKIPAGWIIAARDTKWISDSQEVMLQSIAWGLGTSLFLSIALALIFAYRSETRLARLARVLNGAASGDLDLRYVDSDGIHDDVSRIARLVNQMLDRLSLSMNSLKQVSTDVAHDLRAPLTRLRTRLEPHVMRADLPPDTHADLVKALEDLDSIVATFDAVLRLARMEGGNAVVQATPVDLAALCRNISEMMLPVATDMGHDFQSDCGARSLMVMGDKDMLAQAIVNLVENAFRHCRVPARIQLSAGQDGAQAWLRVCDNGPGIPPAERDKVLRRFYRLEQSRNTAGNGLGLSLVAAIMRLHGGSLALRENKPGLCAELLIPIDNSPPAAPMNLASGTQPSDIGESTS